MAYKNFFPAGYQPYFQPQTNALAQQPQMQPQQNGIIWVQGEAGAKSYLVAPNASVTLWDTESPTIYIKSADATGMPSLKILDYKIRENAPRTISAESNYATKADLEALAEQISALQTKVDGKEKK